jgi:hypothetical protein
MQKPFNRNSEADALVPSPLKSSGKFQQEDFENSYLVEIVTKKLMRDYNNPITSQIELFKNVREHTQDYRSEFVSCKVLDEVHFQKTHYISVIHSVKYLQKEFIIDSSDYVYRELIETDSEVFLQDVPHISRDCSDWVVAENWMAKIFENVSGTSGEYSGKRSQVNYIDDREDEQ